MVDGMMMKKSRVLFFLLYIFVYALSAAVHPEQKSVSPEFFFNYDAALPLHAKVDKQSETESYTMYHVIFNSTHQEKVVALFTVPKQGKPPYPFVLFQHGLTNHKEYITQWEGGVDAAAMLAKEGIGMLAVDALYHGERHKVGMKPFNMFGFGPYPYLARDSMIQAVVDLRRAVDFLQSRKEVDGKKICYMGESMGSILGGTFSGVEKRVRAVVLIVGGGGLQFLFETSLLGMKKEDIKKAVDTSLFFVDPLYWVDKISPRPLLMVGALKDELMPHDATVRLYEKAKNPKKIIWIDSKHVIDAKLFFPDMIAWMKEQMK